MYGVCASRANLSQRNSTDSTTSSWEQHVSSTQAQARLLPIAPVLLMVESQSEPESSNWKYEQQGTEV